MSQGRQNFSTFLLNEPCFKMLWITSVLNESSSPRLIFRWENCFQKDQLKFGLRIDSEIWNFPICKRFDSKSLTRYQKILECANWCMKIYRILPNTLWNSPTVSTLMNSVNKIWGNNCCMAAYKDWVKNLSIPNFELNWKYLKLQSQLKRCFKIWGIKSEALSKMGQ